MEKTQSLPLIAITMGDPSGIGPEIALKALSSRDITDTCRAFIVGDISILNRAEEILGTQAPFHIITAPEDWVENKINVLDMGITGIKDAPFGISSAASGNASFEYIIKSIELAKSKSIAAVVTNPICKESLKKAGVPFPGHTEIFAHETGTRRYSMMFVLDSVAVVHVTTHCSLRNAIDLITINSVLQNIELLHETLCALGIKNPRIAVGGLNPHAGENGLFGQEEILYIAPAIKTAQTNGIDVSGPYPPDTVFMQAFNGEFDGIVAMLHDHGFTALKSRNFERGVNITVGLPIIRTSVGHGTAFNIAGTGQASDQSLKEAILYALKLVKNRNVR
jgi:4-hydroxythreonine-4-phosphate dehydrogenase